MVRKHYRKRRTIKRRKYGRGRPYIKNNKIYFGSGIKRGSDLVLVLSKIFGPVASVIGSLA